MVFGWSESECAERVCCRSDPEGGGNVGFGGGEGDGEWRGEELDECGCAFDGERCDLSKLIGEGAEFGGVGGVSGEVIEEELSGFDEL